MSSDAPPLPDRNAVSGRAHLCRILMQLREYLAQLTHIPLQNPYENLFPDTFENGRQSSGYLPSLSSWLEYRTPPIKQIDLPCNQVTRLKTIYEPSDFTFVSTQNKRQLPGRDSLGLDATKKHARFLQRHPVFQKPAV